MVVEGIQVVSAGLDSISSWSDALGGLSHPLSVDWLVLAQQASSDTDIIAKMQNSWNTFVSTGQVWALLIGIVLGYLFKSFTTF